MAVLVADERFAAPEQFRIADQEYKTGVRAVPLADGGFIAVWTSGGHLLGQKFDALGAPAGGIFQLESDGAPIPSDADLAPLASGGFVATWQNFIISGNTAQWRTEYRLFDASGQPLGPQQPVSTAYAQYASIAALADGGFVITFSAPDADAIGVFAQRFDAQGAKIGGEIAVNTTTAGHQYYSLAAALPGGGFLISWRDSAVTRGQIFDSSGQKVGSEFDIAPAGTYAPSLASLPSGNVLFLYNSGGFGGGELMAKILTPTGAVAVSDFQVNTSTPGGQYMASAAVLPSGEFMVTWRDATEQGDYFMDGEVRGQFFAADGTRIGEEFLVNNVTERGQTEPVSIVFGSDNIAALWIDYQPTRGNAVVSMRLFFPPTFGTESADSFAGTPDRDFYYAYGGDDTVAGADQGDGLDGGEGNDSLEGGGGHDELIAGAGTDVLAGGDGNDILYFGAHYTSDDIASGGAGRDGLVLQGNYTLTLSSGGGLSGLESVSLQGGAVTKYGDRANNLYDYAITLADSFTAAGQQMIVNGQSLRIGEELVFDGSAETDGSFLVSGGRGNDVLRGGGGNDTLLAGPGTDQLFGGGGDDTLYFSRELSGGDRVDGGDGRDVLILQGNYVAGLASVTLAGIEAISLQTGARTTWGDIENHRYDYNLTMADLNVPAGMQLIVNAQSLLLDEDFTFDGSAETDGSFLLFAGHGVDILKGGAGDDVFYFEGGRLGWMDRVDGGAGRDSVVFNGRSGINSFTFGSSSLTGIESISVSNRYAADPSLKPSYAFALHNNNVTPGGSLIVNGSSLAADQTFYVDGSTVAGGNLLLFGGAGTDTLKGGAGADLLLGGLGADSLSGGGGADRFRYDSTSESTAAAADAIGDFQGGTDKVDLSRIDANTHAAGNQAFTWIGSNAFSATGAASAGELRAIADGAGQRLEGDTNGDGIADLVILFQPGTAPLVQGDVLV